MTTAILARKHEIHDPDVVRWLTHDPRAAWLWLPLRLWVGWQWLMAGRHKVVDEAWTGSGVALQSFWQRAVAVPEGGRSPVAFDWYRSFLQTLLDANAHTWFADLVAWGELLVGVALILGAFAGIAAFFGAIMNFNFMLAGSASTNPMLFAIAIGLILAWKVAGHVGFDRWLLPLIGTPWGWARRVHPGTMSGKVPIVRSPG